MLLLSKIGIGVAATLTSGGVATTAALYTLSISNSESINLENPTKDSKVISVYDSELIEDFDSLDLQDSNLFKSLRIAYYVPKWNNNIHVWIFAEGKDVNDSVMSGDLINHSFNDLANYLKSNIEPGNYKIAPLFFNEKLTFGVIGENSIYSVDWNLENITKTDIKSHNFKIGHKNFYLNI